MNQCKRLGPRLVFAFFSFAFSLAQNIAPGLSQQIINNEITQCFPVSAACDAAESGWRIKWRLYPPFHDASNNNYYGNAGVWVITSAEFMRGKNDGKADWIPVLNNLSLAEMFVPYDNGERVYDVSNGSAWGRFRPFPFVRVGNTAEGETFLSRGGLAPPRRFDDTVIAEVVDDHLRWIENRDFRASGKPDRARRGQALQLWATLFAGNYRYVLLYSFADDGAIQVRAGATAENLVDPHGDVDGHGVHVHMPGWRMEFALGSRAVNEVSVVEHIQDRQFARAKVCERAFLGLQCGVLTGGREGGILWDPTKFTSLKVTSREIKNRHSDPKYVAYSILPRSGGNLRTFGKGEEFTEFDFWISRLVPDRADRRQRGIEYRYLLLPSYVQNPEPLDGHAVVIWHRASLLHIPRGEDFGAIGYKAQDGVALTAWGGFDLVPRDLWDKTPFLDRRN